MISVRSVWRSCLSWLDCWLCSMVIVILSNCLVGRRVGGWGGGGGGGAFALRLAVSAVASAQEPFPGLDAYIAKAVQTWKIPAVSVAIVRNDSVLYTKGFGTLSVSDKTPVNDQTLFEIGSSSKAFTATLVAMMVGDGKMRFEDKLTEYLPTFRMYDPIANTEGTLRDALTHRTGGARGG